MVYGSHPLWSLMSRLHGCVCADRSHLWCISVLAVCAYAVHTQATHILACKKEKRTLVAACEMAADTLTPSFYPVRAQGNDDKDVLDP